MWYCIFFGENSKLVSVFGRWFAHACQSGRKENNNGEKDGEKSHTSLFYSISFFVNRHLVYTCKIHFFRLLCIFAANFFLSQNFCCCQTIWINASFFPVASRACMWVCAHWIRFASNLLFCCFQQSRFKHIHIKSINIFFLCERTYLYISIIVL